MKIDIHFHCIPENYVAAMREDDGTFPDKIRTDLSGQEQILLAGGSWRPLGEQFRESQRMLRDTEEAGCDMAVLSVPPHLFHYELDDETGERFTKKINDGIGYTAGKYPNQFMGMATVPLQHPPVAIRELERAVNQLGMRAVQIGSNVNGKNLDEPEFYPFFERAQSLGVMIFVHPCTVLGRERMRRYHFNNLIGNPTDTALAIGSLIYGGILEKLPTLTICFAHAGGTISSLIGRLDHGYRVRPECSSAIPKAPSEYLNRLYFDTIAHSERALLYLIQTVGSERVLIGSDYPYEMGDLHPLSTVGNLKQIANQDRESICGRNAAKLLKIEG